MLRSSRSAAERHSRKYGAVESREKDSGAVSTERVVKGYQGYIMMPVSAGAPWARGQSTRSRTRSRTRSQQRSGMRPALLAPFEVHENRSCLDSVGQPQVHGPLPTKQTFPLAASII